MYNKNMAQNHKAFTLAEILIVISIIIILAIALLLTINPFTQFLRGYDTVRRNDLSKLHTAFENYFADHNCYPTAAMIAQCGSSALAPYLDKVPCDPSTRAPYKLRLLPEGTGCAQKYAVYADLANTKDIRGDLISYCKDTVTVASSDMTYLEIVEGCSRISICQNMYGCRNGACVLLFEDTTPTCGVVYCRSNCNGKDCSFKNPDGSYRYECR